MFTHLTKFFNIKTNIADQFIWYIYYFGEIVIENSLLLNYKVKENIMEKQNDELFAELDRVVVDLEKEAKKTVSKKMTYIHCKRDGHLLLTIPVTVEEED